MNSFPRLADISEELAKRDGGERNSCNIVVLRNITIDPFIKYVEYIMHRFGFKPNVLVGEYDNIFQEAKACSATLINEDTNFVLVMPYLSNISFNLSSAYNSLSCDGIQQEIARLQQFAINVVNAIREKTTATILWFGYLYPVYPTLGIYDYQIQNGQIESIHHINQLNKAFLRSINETYFVDLNQCLAKIGEEAFFDNRFWHLAKAPFSLKACEIIASETAKYFYAAMGKTKKCIVLDCDNTLWGGIIGEDGLTGIQLGLSSPGSIFVEFQNYLSCLNREGILLALCSKNNEADVWDVFSQHPNMVLKKEMISAWQINWEDKVTNIKKLATFLNIGLDAMVFIDDSEFEINFIKQEIPQVETILFDKKKLFNNIKTIKESIFFENLKHTTEDLNRVKMYKAEMERKQILESSLGLDSYLTSLEMTVEINFANAFSIPRVSQQSYKTNQFNLTAKKYSEAELSLLNNSEKHSIIYVHLSDKFGDYGIIGSLILHYLDDVAVIEMFLISCRALGRGVEQVILLHILRFLKEKGCRNVVGEYYSTAKNSQVEWFYQNNNFMFTRLIESDSDKQFVFHLEDKISDDPTHFKKIIDGLNKF